VISAANYPRAHIRGVTISHLRAHAENSILVVGQDHNVSDIVFDDADLTFGTRANAALYGGEFDLAPAPLRPSRMAAHWIPWIYASSVSGLELRNIHFRQENGAGQNFKLDSILESVSEEK
jgi:hypothetical protein